MILHYFYKKENKQDNNINILYEDTINVVKKITSKNYINKTKDFNLSFEITSILLFCIFAHSNDNNDKNMISETQKQKLMNLFTSDIDHSLRLSGVGDMSIGKYVKAYVKKFYFRISKLEEIFFNNEDIILFKLYLVRYKILNENITIIDNNILKEFFLDLKFLIERSAGKSEKKAIYEGLFK